MKKTVLFIIFLIFAGTLSYFGGYYLYVSENPKTEITEQITVQKAVQLSDTVVSAEEQEYYFAKIEQDMLMIYKMPDATLYDSVEVSSLHVQGMEESQLLEGMRFDTLTEVFEFLENAMS